MVGNRYSTWTDDALVDEARRLAGLVAPSMADRGRLGRVRTEIGRRTRATPRGDADWMTGFWLEHAAGPEGLEVRDPWSKESRDPDTLKPNRLLMTFRRWLGDGFDTALGYDSPRWRPEVQRRATEAKNPKLVMGRIQRQEFQAFERTYARRVLDAMPPEDAKERKDAAIRRAVRRVVHDPGAPTDLLRDLIRLAAGNKMARAAWHKCRAEGRDLQDDLEDALFDATRKWVLARKRVRAGAAPRWILEQRQPDAALQTVIRSAAGTRAGS